MTAFAIGLLSSASRSVACYVLAGCLIITSFALAALAGSVSLTALGLALLGYNAGIAATMVAALATTTRRSL
ncbi:MAG TPA: hypothetical protein VL202_13755 [Pararhizobium sp.]|uniref:hypothetical protein n=1 Tax=Pararhizobium sp. TaxID=1977563 RepID=UPI002BCBC5FD|nr:hypothetical protein [Pararhizobium sp.]HTO32226.1 hypothetical protein [Pararhizobium sp.]